VLRRAIERGLLAADFENMTLGMVIDFLTMCQNEDYEAKRDKDRGQTRMATADDIAAF
jgi:hypothetical protein